MKYLLHIVLLSICAVITFTPVHVSADINQALNFVHIFLGGGGNNGPCSYNGDVRESFKGCNPTTGLASDANIDLDVEARRDFRDIVEIFTRRFQIIASILAIAGLVFVGLLLVAPVKEETKSKAKSGFLYATLGFFIAIVASIIVNAIVDIMYDIFG